MEFETIVEEVREFWPHLIAGLSILIALLASAHVVMYKRDSRSAIGWVGIIWLVPVVGAVLYVLLGINRIQRRALMLRTGNPQAIVPEPTQACESEELLRQLGPEKVHLAALEKLVCKLTGRTLRPGNKVDPLAHGDETYPAMLEAIAQARHSVTLSTYIFNNDRVGRMFVDALAQAKDRGVEVRVLIDDIGARYTWPSIEGHLRAARIPLARFLPTLVRGWFAYANLRNHRKLLVIDGRIGFTGGLNIREGHWSAMHPNYFIQDLHFRLEGPIVAHLQEVFVGDWAFCTGELLEGEAWFPKLGPAGEVPARGISTGPDSDLDKLRLALLGALASAESSISIITPYFLPDASLITALNVAALRGVQVDIFLPEENNLSLVQWASMAMLWQVLERGCRVWFIPPPFDHSKLMIVDRAWSLFGSANWDPRSLRLNFEFDVECYDRRLAERLEAIVCSKRQQARRVTLETVDGRSIPVRLRDGLARLLTPYL